MTPRRHSLSLKARANALAPLPLMAVALLLTYATVIPASLVALVDPHFAAGGPQLEKKGIAAMLLVGVIVAPLVETALTQWACIRLLRRFGCRAGVAMFASAALFGIAHTYSLFYMLMMAWVGLVLAAVFVIEDERGGRPFVLTASVHAMHNGIAALYFIFVA
ncbi:CPBP family glutamic-type intramembrane protease [Paraburkholderia caballeronis]|uniref:CPBP family glutamic-type intramembrane protease n=1 Tax=Paraburkholderia caballeronis TaxID=416943 RepID=UPI0010658F8E|nr:CPBP family glutamic-type intramembrane protease [Paraburkholderia caballeronis]TDV19397.1 hypothetical protein C7408_102140 [Paraburkholderia caballeronis]TDV21997.1 hypothetical protein C7406_101140 [Paraburkholderia caballeronis]TDV28901.1 hypothetical protein C7404_102141 [Paraburkholderia caballeronis]